MRSLRMAIVVVALGAAFLTSGCGLLSPQPATVVTPDSTEMLNLSMKEPGQTLKSLGYQPVTLTDKDTLVYTWNCDRKLTLDKCGKLRHALATNARPNIYVNRTNGNMELLEGAPTETSQYWNVYMSVPNELNRIDKLTTEQLNALFGAMTAATKAASNVQTGHEGETRSIIFAAPTTDDAYVKVVNYEVVVSVRPGV